MDVQSLRGAICNSLHKQFISYETFLCFILDEIFIIMSQPYITIYSVATN